MTRMSTANANPAGVTGPTGTATVPAATARRTFTRDQRTTIVYGILCIVLVIVILQLWLFTATMNAFLGGDEVVIWPAAAASMVCLGLNVGLLRYLYNMERV
jgi:hypothetical protein